MDSQEFQQESEVVGSQAEALFNDILTRDDATLEVASADNAASASENVAAQQNDILTQQEEGSQAVGMCGDCFSQLMPSQQSSSRVLYVVMDESQGFEEMQNEPEQAADEDPMLENVIDESNQVAETDSRRSFAYFSSTSEDEDSYYSDEEAYQDEDVALSSGSQLAATMSRPMNVMRSRSRSTGASSALNARRHPPSQVLPSSQSRMSKMKAMKKIATPKKTARRSASKTPRRRRRSTSRSTRKVQAKSKTIRKLATKAARKPTAAVNFVEPQHDVMPPTNSGAMKTPRRRRRARSASRSTRKVQSKSKAIRKQPKKQVKTARKQPPRKATKKSSRKM